MDSHVFGVPQGDQSDVLRQAMMFGSGISLRRDSPRSSLKPISGVKNTWKISLDFLVIFGDFLWVFW